MKSLIDCAIETLKEFGFEFDLPDPEHIYPIDLCTISLRDGGGYMVVNEEDGITIELLTVHEFRRFFSQLRAHLNTGHLNPFVTWYHIGEHRNLDKEETLRRLCLLCTQVSVALFGQEQPHDCFCGEKEEDPLGFFMNEATIDFIWDAVRKAMNERERNPNVCCVCHVNPVCPEDGQDTCDSCAKRI